jgi:hypothetical protein
MKGLKTGGTVSAYEAVKPCAVCLFRVGFGVKVVKRLTFIPRTTARRIQKKLIITQSAKRKSANFFRWENALHIHPDRCLPRHKDAEEKLRINLSSRLSRVMRGIKSGRALSEFVGCDDAFLRRHIEAQFTRRMTWQNYGDFWEVDHTLPVSAFNHANEAQVKLCWNWQNLRPLEKEKNRAKGDRIINGQLPLTLEVA